MSSHPVVLRVAKLSTWGAIAASGQHTWRERDTPNADPERTPDNEDWRPVRSAAELRDAVSKRLERVTDKPTTKNPVKCLEYLVTANRVAFAEHGGAVDSTAYFRDALQWIERKHGADNVVAVNVQRDEAAPHLVVYVVPLVEREAKERKRSVIVGTNPDGTKRRETVTVLQEAGVKLSASHFVDGRDKLSRMQTEFAAEVGHRHGLQRGVEGSRATHQTVRQHYAALATQPKAPAIDVPDPALADRVNPRAYGERVAQAVVDQLQPAYSALQARAATAEADKKRAAEMAAAAKAAKAEADQLRGKLATLQKWADPILKLAKASPEAAKEFYRQVQERTAALAKPREKGRPGPARKPGPER